MATILSGTNDFLRSRALTKLTADFVRQNGGLALEKLDGEYATANQMIAALQSLPFLAPAKMVVLSHPSAQKEWAENIADILKQIPETTQAVIIEPKLDKRLGYYKTLKKQPGFKEFGDADAANLPQWASEYAHEQGGELKAVDARLLIDRIGPNQQLLASEIDKLVNFSPLVTKPNIELLTELMPRSTVFELLEAAFAGKTAQALELYKEQRALKVEPQAIIAMLAWQLHVLAVIAASEGQSADIIAKTAKLNPFVVRKSQNLARNLGLERIKKLVDDLLEIDLKLKSTTINPDEALQLYLITIPNN
jgi:DNA polymerase III subunit delta